MKRLGKYEIIRELGRGAMGVVFKARDPLIGRLVALKTITAGLGENTELLERFYREAQAAGALQHPNVVTVYEMGEAESTPFIAMEYLEGESLEQMIGRRPQLPLAQKLGYIVQTCRALDYAHRHGIVHRDIKPGNIMITREGAVKVVDFGIARLVDTSKTQTGTLLGTLGYMSPQQLRGKHADERSDIWAVGVVLYEVLSYERPFSGQNHAALLLSILQDEPVPIAAITRECPSDLEQIVNRALQKDDAERYQSMEDLLRELEPLWAARQRASVEEMLEGARELARAGKSPEAHDLLQRALLLDTSNIAVKALLDHVERSSEQGRGSARLKQHLAKAAGLLQDGLFLDARREAEAALKINPQDSNARSLLESVTQREQQARQKSAEQKTFINDQIRSMRSAIDRGELSDAIEVGRGTLAEVGQDRDISQLIRFAERERQLRERKRQMEREIAEIFAQLEAGRFDEGARRIEQLQELEPLEPRLQRLIEAARERRVPSRAALVPALDSAAQVEAAREYVFEPGSGSRTGQPAADAQGASSQGFASSQPRRVARARMQAPQTEPTHPRMAPQPGEFSLLLERKKPKRLKQVSVAAAGLILLAIVAGWAYRRQAHWQHRIAPNAAANATENAKRYTPPSASGIPPVESLKQQQQKIIDQAHSAADQNDYQSAEALLDQAERLGGPLNSSISELRQQFTHEEQNAEARQVAAQERRLWDQAQGEVNASKLDEAQKAFQKILALPEGGHRRAEAQRYVDQVIPSYRLDAQLWQQAGQTWQSSDPGRGKKTLDILDQLIAARGPHQQQAQDLRKELLTLAGRNAVRNQTEPRAADPPVERALFNQLEAQFREATKQPDEVARQQLNELLPQFRTVAQAGGVLATNARDYANNLIPAALKAIDDRMARTSSDALETARFNQALLRFKNAVAAKDGMELRTHVLAEFESLAKDGGAHSSEAARYVSTLIPAALHDITPWPVLGCSRNDAGMAPSIQAGALVACGLLDAPKLQWVRFSWPDFPSRARQAGQAEGTAMLSLTVDQNGTVIDAKPRGRPDAYGFTDSAIAASRQWRTTAPHAQGKPVHTEFSVDVPIRP